MSAVEIVALASGAMVFQDVLGTCLTQAQARDRAVLSGWLDTVAWGAAIATTSISVTALQGHNTGLKVAVIAGVSAANFCGSWLGTIIGKRYIKPLPSALELRVGALESQMGVSRD